MRTNIKVTGLTLTPEIQSYFDRRMQKVELLLASDPSAQLDAQLERMVTHSAGEEFRVEITITGSHMQTRSETTEATLHGAIDAAEELVLHELRKNKGKRIHMVRRQAARVKNFLKGFRE